MSSHDLTIAGYALFAGGVLLLEALGRSGRSRVPTFGTVLSYAMRTRPGRMGVIAGWAWLGMHFFAR